MLLYLLIKLKLIAALCSLVVFLKEKVWNENQSPGRVPKGGEYNKKDFVSSEKCTFRIIFSVIFPEQTAEETTNEAKINFQSSGDGGILTIINRKKKKYTYWVKTVTDVCLCLDQQPPGGGSKPQKPQQGGPRQTFQRPPVQVWSRHGAHQRGRQHPFETNCSFFLKRLCCNTLRANVLATTGGQTQADRGRSRQKQGGDGAQVSAPSRRHGGADGKAQGRLNFCIVMLSVRTAK